MAEGSGGHPPGTVDPTNTQPGIVRVGLGAASEDGVWALAGGGLREWATANGKAPDDKIIDLYTREARRVLRAADPA
ncbi:MAG: hypothetical protein K0S82_1789 [Gaiellaceae bacterium]|nr:hypothetical protein [Gaiellaceae bacterium]